MNILKSLGRILKLTAIIISIFFLVVIIINISPPLWKKWVTYPALEKQRTKIRGKYKKPPIRITRDSYQGLMHSHSYRSHDSRGTLPEIMDAAQKANLDFIFLSDHKRYELDTFPRGYHGVYDGIIIESGTEHSSGLMVSPFDSTVLDWSKGDDAIIHEVVDKGGLAMYVHSEAEHDWGNPDFQGMEIYNIHTDLLDEDAGLLPLIINHTINDEELMHWAFREIYDDQVEIHALWDSLNMHRKIIGFGAVDAHNNLSMRARKHQDGKVEWVGPNADTLTIREPTWLDKLLLGEPDKFGWAFKWEMDPYFISFNYVNNHVFCDTFSNENIKDNVLKGHVIVAFENLAPAKGFQYFASNYQDSVTAIVGDSVTVSYVREVNAVSPFPVKFQLFRNGTMVDESDESYEYNYKIKGQSGNYRLVARLRFDDQWNTWALTNPIYIN